MAACCGWYAAAFAFVAHHQICKAADVAASVCLQDAAEYLGHLLQLISRSEHAAAGRLGIGDGQVRIKQIRTHPTVFGA